MCAQRFDLNKSPGGKLIILAVILCSAAAAQPYVYATNTLGNAIAIIDSQTYSLVANVVTGDFADPGQVAVSPDGNYIYVTNQGNNTLSILSAASKTVVKTLTVGTLPYGLAITPDSAFVYVANQGSNNVSVIDAVAQSVIATIPVAAGPFAAAATPDGSFVWVTGTMSNQISVISTASRTVVSILPATNYPNAIAFSPDGTRAYVTNEFASVVAVYDTASRSIIATITAPGSPTSIAVSADGSRVYVTSADDQALYVIDAGTNQTIDTIPVGAFPDGVAVSADNTRAWVSNSQDYTLSVVDIVHGTVLSTLYGVAYYPQGIAMAPEFATLPIRVNAGGPSYTDPQGNLWTADWGYLNGVTRATTRSIGNTSMPELYQGERLGFGALYKFAVPNGIYTVNLKFAELRFREPGSRIFDVKINGETVLAGLDIVAVAGGDCIAWDYSSTVTVSGGQIVIRFTGLLHTPSINAIEILQAGH